MTKYLLTYLFHSTVLLLASWLVAKLFLISYPKTRASLFHFALVAGFITALSVFLPIKLFVPLPPIYLSAQSQLSDITNLQLNEVTRVRTEKLSERSEDVRQTFTKSKIDFFVWIALLLGVSFMTISFARAFASMKYLLSKTKPLMNEEIFQIIKSLTKELSLKRCLRTIECSSSLSPFTVGWRTLVLPKDISSTLNSEEARAVLAHELVHIKRNDPIWTMILSALSQIAFFQPLNFLLLKSWLEAREEVADAQAIYIVQLPSPLANGLLKIARQQTHHLLAANIAGRSLLSVRIEKLLKGEKKMKKAHQVIIWLIFLCLTSVLPVLSVAQTKGTAKTIVIDAGHGGEDSGAVANYKESDIVLSVALKLKVLLESQGFQVLLTRQGDEFVSLDDRLAMSKEGDAFISLHANYAPSPIVSGIETYTRSQLPEVELFAETIQAELVKATAAKDRGVRITAEIFVLRNLSIPSIMVGLGYLSNPEEAGKLTTPAYQQTIAEALAKAIEKTLN